MNLEETTIHWIEIAALAIGVLAAASWPRCLGVGVSRVGTYVVGKTFDQVEDGLWCRSHAACPSMSNQW